MNSLPDSIQNLIDEFAKLPGIGPKTASRLTFYILTKPSQDIEGFGQKVLNLKKGLQQCQKCYNIAEESPCRICSNPKRDPSKIMVVEEPLDVVAIEKTAYDGLYHVLGGAISPIDGIGPDDLRIRELIDRIKKDSKISEVILATNPSLEEEATAMYINKMIGKE